MLQLINFNLKHYTFCSLLLCYLFIGSGLYAITDVMQDPVRYNGQQVEVRGFLYRNQEGSLVLRSEPGLKSCCINKDGPQIIVRSDGIEPSLQAKTLEGVFHIEKLGIFVLDNAKEKKDGHFPFLLIGAAVFMFGAIWTLWTKWT